MRYEQPTSEKPVAMDGKIFTDQDGLGNYLKDKYHLRTPYDIMSCSTCHR